MKKAKKRGGETRAPDIVGRRRRGCTGRKGEDRRGRIGKNLGICRTVSGKTKNSGRESGGGRGEKR